jgi:hypothetical protein
MMLGAFMDFSLFCVNRAKDSRACARAKCTHVGRGNTGCPVLFHPDYTVGPGIQPGLLTSLDATLQDASMSARGLRRMKVHIDDYRRWGIAPRPENVFFMCRRTEVRYHERGSVRINTAFFTGILR